MAEQDSDFTEHQGAKMYGTSEGDVYAAPKIRLDGLPEILDHFRMGCLALAVSMPSENNRSAKTAFEIVVFSFCFR